MLCRWFVGLAVTEPVWHTTVFAKNRDRLLEGAVAEEFFSMVVNQARRKRLLSDDHFTVDGTIIEAGLGRRASNSRRMIKVSRLQHHQIRAAIHRQLPEAETLQCD